MADFVMPALGADMETGKVVEWCVEPGARVRPGDIVAVVETHKGAIDVEIFLDGVIEDLVPLGRELPVGAVLAHVRAEGEAVGAAPPSPAAPPAPSVAPPAPPVPVPPVTAPTPAGPRLRTPVSPAARRPAMERGIDPEGLQGTGVDGSVTLADVELAVLRQARVPPSPVVPPRRGFDPVQMRQAIAAAMTRSKREIPHYYVTSTLDFGRAGAWLEAYNAGRAPDERLLPAVLLLKATARALVERPQLNGFWVEGAFRPGAGIHVGWAIALRGGGLVSPAIHDVDRKSVPDLMVALRDLIQRARAGGLRSSELTDATVTITSLGDRGADSVLGVIYPPQVAMIGFGRVLERPWIFDGAVAPRRVVAASLAGDHRANDGHLGGLLLGGIEHALQSPDSL
jgi:pyruvate dehydrogenase E2 component (dihydrolipoamide acetyltransferase)